MTYKKTFFHPNVLLRMFLVSLFIGVFFFLLAMVFAESEIKELSVVKPVTNLEAAIAFPSTVTTKVFGAALIQMFYIAFAFILFSTAVTIKTNLDASYYLGYLANSNNTTLSPIKIHSKIKYLLIVILYTGLLFSYFYIIHLIFENISFDYEIIFMLPLIYVLIYQNWIFSLKLAIGKDFKTVYQENKSDFIKKGIFYIFLMHIPFVVILQPWFLISLGDIYFQNTKMKNEE